jgi:transposase-like protein
MIAGKVIEAGMANRTIRTVENRRRFLELVGETGNVRDACRALDLHRTTVYDWRREDADFAAAWDEAIALGTEGMEDEARNRAINGSDVLLIFMLKALKPDKYRERSTVEMHTTIRHELRTLPLDELRARLDQLRLEQDGSLARPVAKPTLIEGNVIDIDDHRD